MSLLGSDFKAEEETVNSLCCVFFILPKKWIEMLATQKCFLFSEVWASRAGISQFPSLATLGSPSLLTLGYLPHLEQNFLSRTLFNVLSGANDWLQLEVLTLPWEISVWERITNPKSRTSSSNLTEEFSWCWYSRALFLPRTLRKRFCFQVYLGNFRSQIPLLASHSQSMFRCALKPLNINPVREAQSS